MFQPQAPQPSPAPSSPSPAPMSTPNAGMLPQQTPVDGQPPQVGVTPGEDQVITPEEVEAHLDKLPDEAKSFLAEHLTPEFVQAIGLISGPEVANVLNKYADPNKVLVPVPRQIAEQYLAEQKAQQGAPAQSGQPAPSQSPTPQGAPAQSMPPQGGGMMAPKM